MTQTPVEDFVKPRLETLMKDVEQAGFSREVAVAVLINLLTGPEFDTVSIVPERV